MARRSWSGSAGRRSPGPARRPAPRRRPRCRRGRRCRRRRPGRRASRRSVRRRGRRAGRPRSAARVSPGLRLGWSRHCSVVMSVPSPSTVIDAALEHERGPVAREAEVVGEAAPARASSCVPRRELLAPPVEGEVDGGPLAVGPTTPIGPLSRTHESSIGMATTSIPGPQARRAASTVGRSGHHRDGLVGGDGTGDGGVVGAGLLVVAPQSTRRAGQHMMVRSCGAPLGGHARTRRRRGTSRDRRYREPLSVRSVDDPASTGRRRRAVLAAWVERSRRAHRGRILGLGARRCASVGTRRRPTAAHGRGRAPSCDASWRWTSTTSGPTR